MRSAGHRLKEGCYVENHLNRTYCTYRYCADYGWSGNKDVGEGRMEIIESTPSSKIVIKLDFIKPFEGHNMVEFLLQPQGDATIVTQAMYGASPFISKLMELCFNIDKMVGGKYKEGLASLKALAEK